MLYGVPDSSRKLKIIMVGGTYISHSEVFDRPSTIEEIITLLQSVSLRHGIFVLSRLNLALRQSMEMSRQKFGEVQRFLIVSHLDFEAKLGLEGRFASADTSDRPVFVQPNILNVLRLLILHSTVDRDPNEEDDERVRHTIGRACLMMNDLLVSEQEKQDLLAETEESRLRALMAQSLASFELANGQDINHLVPRMHVMFRLLLNQIQVTERIATVASGFSFDREFRRTVGISVDRWLAVIFAI